MQIALRCRGTFLHSSNFPPSPASFSTHPCYFHLLFPLCLYTFSYSGAITSVCSFPSPPLSIFPSPPLSIFPSPPLGSELWHVFRCVSDCKCTEPFPFVPHKELHYSVHKHSLSTHGWWGFPGGSDCKASGCNADLGSIPGLGRPRRRTRQPTPVFLPRESHGWKSLVGYSPWGHKELDMTEWLHFHFHG